ncbi:MAG: hypothetical protein GF368_02365 [Candidatus Aenigmarchaeota archaeon]|nr:hypothetical protein [Candidatus Aenigmarchaeota archaeon]
MKKLIPFILILLLIPSILAITWPTRSLLQDIRNAMAGSPVWPYDSLRNVFFFVFIPFWGVFAVTFGLLTNLQIFHLKRVNLLLSILFAMSLLYYGALLWLVSLIYTLTGMFTTVAFFVIFVVGVYLFGRKKKSGWEAEIQNVEDLSKEIKRVRKHLKEAEDELRIVREDLTDTRSPNRIKQLKEREKRLLNTVDNLRKQIVEMKTKGETIKSSLVAGVD